MNDLLDFLASILISLWFLPYISTTWIKMDDTSHFLPSYKNKAEISWYSPSHPFVKLWTFLFYLTSYIVHKKIVLFISLSLVSQSESAHLVEFDSTRLALWLKGLCQLRPPGFTAKCLAVWRYFGSEVLRYYDKSSLKEQQKTAHCVTKQQSHQKCN